MRCTWVRRWAVLLAAGISVIGLLAGCGTSKEPVNLTIWHYYTGHQMASFDALVEEFNNTSGKEKGIYVVSYSKSSVRDLETAVGNALNGELGAEPLPDLFSAYTDTAFFVEKRGKLANLSEYLTAKELEAYIPAYIEEGCIASDGTLRIFPIAKSTEVMILNKTDWEPFAAATGVKVEQLRTVEGVVEVSKAYYEWTDGLTPDVPDDGRAFYGRDAVANYFLVGASQLGQELLTVNDDRASVSADKETFRKLWDNYYVPMVEGWFGAYGKFRSDDVKTGDLLAYTGSTASAGYFPSQVERDTGIYPIEYMVLDAPIFEGGQRIAVQQGAGMVVSKSDARREKAAVEFLRWFAQPEHNVVFGAEAGYLPVTKQGQQPEVFRKVVSDKGLNLKPVTEACIWNAIDVPDGSTYYSPRTYLNSMEVRNVLEYGLSDKAQTDIKAIQAAVESGCSRAEAAEAYVSESAFETWYEEFTQSLNQTAAQ